MARRPLDPRTCNIGHDANAVDKDGSDRDRLVDRFNELSAAGGLTIVVAGGVRDEIGHPRTPASVKETVLPHVFNLRPTLVPHQKAERQRITAILQGNAQPGKHVADASHLSEAAETGCAYFITNDKRILNKRIELAAVLPPSLTIVTLLEFFRILEAYETNRDDQLSQRGSSDSIPENRCQTPGVDPYHFR